MLATCPPPTDEPLIASSHCPESVRLANGQTESLAAMSREALHVLQWEQEQEYAREIMAHPKGSCERSAAIREAYDSICTILSAQSSSADKPLVMGLDPRYVRLVLGLLQGQRREGCGQPRLFEVGYGCGELLATVREHGFAVGGIEMSAIMRQQALNRLGPQHATSLLLSDLRSVEPDSLAARPTLIYWNDVMEHIPPDEVADYLKHIHRLLAPGGLLVTITPHWLLRPMDVTGDFCPPRTVARGLHLREYRLAEVTRLLRQAGFRRVTTDWR
jgi:SAM-dependent methyltransferase